MIKRTLGCIALLGWLIAASAPLQADHSLAGVYDLKKETELAGTVTSVKFTNPHGSLAVAVKNADGASTEWVMTLGSATALAQERDRQDRRECPAQRRQYQGEVPAREGRQSVGVSPDGDHAGRARDPDRRS